MTLDEYRALTPATRPHRRAPEQDLQIAIANMLRLRAPRLLWWFCPNGGNLSKAQRGKFKAMGLRAGVADLHFVIPGGLLAVIELKAGRGSQSEGQVAFAASCEAEGVPYLVCRSVAEVEGALAAWGVTLAGSDLRQAVPDVRAYE